MSDPTPKLTLDEIRVSLHAKYQKLSNHSVVTEGNESSDALAEFNALLVAVSPKTHEERLVAQVLNLTRTGERQNAPPAWLKRQRSLGLYTNRATAREIFPKIQIHNGKRLVFQRNIDGDLLASFRPYRGKDTRDRGTRGQNRRSRRPQQSLFQRTQSPRQQHRRRQPGGSGAHDNRNRRQPGGLSSHDQEALLVRLIKDQAPASSDRKDEYLGSRVGGSDRAPLEASPDGKKGESQTPPVKQASGLLSETGPAGQPGKTPSPPAEKLAEVPEDETDRLLEELASDAGEW